MYYNTRRDGASQTYLFHFLLNFFFSFPNNELYNLLLRWIVTPSQKWWVNFKSINHISFHWFKLIIISNVQMFFNFFFTFILLWGPCKMSLLRFIHHGKPISIFGCQLFGDWKNCCLQLGVFPLWKWSPWDINVFHVILENNLNNTLVEENFFRVLPLLDYHNYYYDTF